MKVKYFNSCAAKKRLEIVESYVEDEGAAICDLSTGHPVDTRYLQSTCYDMPRVDI